MMKHLRVVTPKHKDGLKGILIRIPLRQFRTADDLDLRHTLDSDIDCLVLSTNIGTFAMRILYVADGNKLPVATGELSGFHPLVGHSDPGVGPIRVRVLRNEGLEFLWLSFLT